MLPAYCGHLMYKMIYQKIRNSLPTDEFFELKLKVMDQLIILKQDLRQKFFTKDRH